MNVDPASLDTRAIAQYASAAKAASHSMADFLMQTIPATVVDAFAKGEILQALLFSVLFGFALFVYGDKGSMFGLPWPIAGMKEFNPDSTWQKV